MGVLGKWIVPLLALVSSTCGSEDGELPGETVLAWAGSSATLPCVAGRALASTPRAAYRKLALYWSLGEGVPGRRSSRGPRPAGPTLLMVANDGVVKRGLAGPGRRLRVAGERLDGGDYSLVVRHVQPSDSGAYRCSVRHGESRLQKDVRLYVIQVIADIPGTPVEGSGLRLVCGMSEALSQASVRWRRGGSPVQVSDRIGTEDQGRTLRIKALEVRDRGAWECHVSYDGKTINVPYTLEIFGFAGPKEEIPTTYAGLGAPARLCLGLAPTVPEGRVQAGWLRGNGTRREDTAAISGSRLVSELGSGHLTLTLLPVLPSDRGLYTGYLNVSGRRIERTVRLALAQVVASRPGPVSVGSALRLEVNTSYPEGVETVECRRENGSAGDEDGWTREADGSLYIARVTASQAGNWTCNLYRHGGLVGSVGYLLDVSALDYSVGDPNLSSNRITLLAVFTLLLLLIVFTIFFIQRTLRSRRQNFPGLEVTLATAAVPVKKM